MRVGNSLVGIQLIDADGTKKFLYGQRTIGATHSFKAGYNGLNVVCEGYATALSIKAALTSMRRPYALHVCFSAGNMKKVAATLKPGLVISDNDESRTGELAAKSIGWPYWMSDNIGEDANDFHNRVKLFTFSQSLKKSIMLCR
jgi:putative DNA primase/helicase